MAKCDSYHQHGMSFRCYGTKAMEECTCGGDQSKCDFYPEKRQQKQPVLKPCPFCGGEAFISSDKDYIFCSSCRGCVFVESTMLSDKTADEAVAAMVDNWNRRAEDGK